MEQNSSPVSNEFTYQLSKNHCNPTFVSSKLYFLQLTSHETDVWAIYEVKSYFS